MNSVAILLAFAIFALSGCRGGDKWDPNLHADSDSLLRLKGESITSILARSEVLYVNQTDRDGMASPTKLNATSKSKVELKGGDLVTFVKTVREGFLNQASVADDYEPLFQINIIDKTGRIIVNWRIRRNPVNSEDWVVVLPTGGMYKIKPLKEMSAIFNPNAEAEP